MFDGNLLDEDKVLIKSMASDDQISRPQQSVAEGSGGESRVARRFQPTL